MKRDRRFFNSEKGDLYAIESGKIGAVNQLGRIRYFEPSEIQAARKFTKDKTEKKVLRDYSTERYDHRRFKILRRWAKGDLTGSMHSLYPDKFPPPTQEQIAEWMKPSERTYAS